MRNDDQSRDLQAEQKLRPKGLRFEVDPATHTFRAGMHFTSAGDLCFADRVLRLLADDFFQIVVICRNLRDARVQSLTHTGPLCSTFLSPVLI